MDDAAIARLSQEMYDAAQLRDMCRHAGFQIFKKALEEKITLAKNEWLNARSKEEAEEIRIKTKIYSEVFDLIKSKIVKGDGANLTLQNLGVITPATADKEN